MIGLTLIGMSHHFAQLLSQFSPDIKISLAKMISGT